MANFTKEQVDRALAQPNGAENLMENHAAAFDAAWELFAQEGHIAACAFLCRCAKRLEYKQKLNAALGESRAPLRQAILAEAPKLRKNAARLAGALGCEADAPALCQALKQETQRFVRPSQLLALGALGGEAAEAALKTYAVAPAASAAEERHVQEETDALRTARKRFIALPKHTFTQLPCPYEIELLTPSKLADSLAFELTALGIRPAAIHSSSIRVHTQDVAKLFAARSFFEALFPAAASIAPQPQVIAEKARAFFHKLLPACHSGPPPFGYRIEIRTESEPGHQPPLDRGKLSRDIARGIDDSLLTNAPGDYEAELRVVLRQNGSANLYVKLYTLLDHRFDYRVGALPASMHPVTAAAVLRSARGYLTPNARVLDPCCGSGAFLFERAQVTPCASLTGVDIAHAAIEIARANEQHAQTGARFIVNDCLRFEAERPYDEVLANLPFGNRVGSHNNNLRLYAELLNRLPLWVKRGGIAILYTMEYTLLKSLIRERPNLKLISQQRTDAGGLTPTIFIIKVG
ncbi:MAG: methyltransferase domain-containing protein [Christensenellaceae bacterium]|jgi:SAM-dependent methyltransferase|nr:methyltransferase domain-containing protein [Christensenellaceae bacterium]